MTRFNFSKKGWVTRNNFDNFNPLFLWSSLPPRDHHQIENTKFLNWSWLLYCAGTMVGLFLSVSASNLNWQCSWSFHNYLKPPPPNFFHNMPTKASLTKNPNQLLLLPERNKSAIFTFKSTKLFCYDLSSSQFCAIFFLLEKSDDIKG